MVIDGLHGLALAPGGFRRSAPTSPTPSPGGPLHRIAAFSASGKRTAFLPGCNQGIVRALRAVHSPMPLPGGPLHRTAASDFVALLRHPLRPRRAGPCTGQQPLPQAERELFFCPAATRGLCAPCGLCIPQCPCRAGPCTGQQPRFFAPLLTSGA